MNHLRMSLSFLLLLLLLQPVDAQKPSRVRSRNLGITTLALNPLVHKELKLSDKQKASLQKAGAETRKAVTQAQALDEKKRKQKLTSKNEKKKRKTEKKRHFPLFTA